MATDFERISFCLIDNIDLFVEYTKQSDRTSFFEEQPPRVVVDDELTDCILCS